jgi:hypothetical protein
VERVVDLVDVIWLAIIRVRPEELSGAEPEQAA